MENEVPQDEGEQEKRLSAMLDLTAQSVILISDLHQHFTKGQLRGLLAFASWSDMVSLTEYESGRHPEVATEIRKVLLESFQEQVDAAPL